MRDAAKQVLEYDEGKVNVPYRCSAGYWTIGIGHFIGVHLTDLKVSDSIVDAFFEEDFKKHWQVVLNVFGSDFVESLEDARKVALLSLAFTLGEKRLRKFTNTIPAIKAKDWSKAVFLLKGSKWARDIDPHKRAGIGRDDRIFHMLENGTFPSVYGISQV